MQLSAPLSLASYPAPLLTYRAVWFQIWVNDIQDDGYWPTLNVSTNYWVVVTPGSPMVFLPPGFAYNGIIWTGLDIAHDFIPANVRDDNTGGNLFTARELNSQRFAGDMQLGANTSNGVAFVKSTAHWGAVNLTNYGTQQYKNWQALNSSIRYGLQILADQPLESTTATLTCMWRMACKNYIMLILDKYFRLS